MPSVFTHKGRPAAHRLSSIATPEKGTATDAGLAAGFCYTFAGFSLFGRSGIYRHESGLSKSVLGLCTRSLRHRPTGYAR
ncbi:hypothetical protein P389DRAFT_166594 [Cystobasidium minutum MCA 4210]|uniref:uncharacterized protein n=1 Tax=Cystobasidium minutum MCA 4210 TaxID=1397322 RepID=UPI0034CF7F3B|eukprot:jgi/Rhomi1/166594/fgenesh1_kg.2_\